jgi:integrase
MKNDNKSDYTIRFTDKALTYIAKRTALNGPEAVKSFIASLNSTDAYKRNLCIAYNRYCKHQQITSTKPLYRAEARSIKIPTKEKLQMIIASCGKTFATKLTLSLETGIRPVELHNLKVKDLDLDQKIVYPTTAKNGAPRALKISQSLQRQLQEHIIKNNLQPNDKLFKGNATTYGAFYRTKRNKLAKKLNDPTIQQIRLYDFRHYFCTKKLYDLSNPYIVMNLMGHKRLSTTQIYMHYLDLGDPEYIVESTKDEKRADELIAKNFEYVLTTPDGHMKFRKRK